MSLGSRLATLVLASAALAACAQDPRPAEEGERLWRQAVWNLDSQGFAPAIPHLEQAVRDSAGAPSVRVAFLLASAYVFAGRPEAADPLLPIVRSGPPSPGPMLIDGYEAAMQHVRPDAELALSACLARVGADDPFRDELTYLALLWRGQERCFAAAWEPAIEDLEAAYAMARERGVAPNRTLARSLAEAHRMLFQYRRAEEISRDAAEADPAWAPHAYDLALVCELQSRLKDARFWYEESLRRDRSYAAPHMKLARLALDAGERARAREHLDQFDALTREKAAEVGAPRRPDVESEIAAGSGAYWLAVGESHEKEGDAIGAKVAYGRAREALLRALEHSPSCMRALTLLIRVGALLGEDAETLARWKRTLDALRERRSVEPASVDAARTFC